MAEEESRPMATPTRGNLMVRGFGGNVRTDGIFKEKIEGDLIIQQR
jgi:hypothetical protein